MSISEYKKTKFLSMFKDEILKIPELPLIDQRSLAERHGGTGKEGKNRF